MILMWPFLVPLQGICSTCIERNILTPLTRDCQLPFKMYSQYSSFGSNEWLRQNFSLQYQYSIRYASNENKEKYQSRNSEFIHYQILWTNITRILWQTVGRVAYKNLAKILIKIPITSALSQVNHSKDPLYPRVGYFKKTPLTETER